MPVDNDDDTNNNASADAATSDTSRRRRIRRPRHDVAEFAASHSLSIRRSTLSQAREETTATATKTAATTDIIDDDNDVDDDNPQQPSLPQLGGAVGATRSQKWLSSLYRSDPRCQVHQFFFYQQQQQQQQQNSMTTTAISSSSSDIDIDNEDETPHQQQEQGMFTVWRPTSREAICRIMSQQGVGKGLEIKGKSSRCGVLSGFVPFLQIDLEEHISKIRSLPRDGRTRIFFVSQQARDTALTQLTPYQHHLLETVATARRTVTKGWKSFRATSRELRQKAVASLQKRSSKADKDSGEEEEHSQIQTQTSRRGRLVARLAKSHQSETANFSTKSMGKDDTEANDVKAEKEDEEADVEGNTDSNSSPPKRRLLHRIQDSKVVSKLKDSATSLQSHVGDSKVVSKLKGSATTLQSHVASSLRLDEEHPGHKTRDWAFKRLLLLEMDDPSIQPIDDYAKADPPRFGIELPDRLLWQAFVVDQDISRPVGSDYYTGRPSQPAFQDMNFMALYKTRKHQTSKAQHSEPRVVLYQTIDCASNVDAQPDSENGDDIPKDDETGNDKETEIEKEATKNRLENPLDPRGLIMAYEEDGRVLPVVSDFDCFTMGTRGVTYHTPLPSSQIELLQWCVEQIGQVLKTQDADPSANWTARWLHVLKTQAAKGFHPEIPRFGFGDDQSYQVIAQAVQSLKSTGAVRHGAESFNYYFPQDLDEEFLIVSQDLPGKVPWTYVNEDQLQNFLLQQIDQGFTFPLNPKWILCDDPKWHHIYSRLISSESSNVKNSMQVWFPLETGVRERMELIRSQHPNGFVYQGPVISAGGTEAMDLATLELDQFLTLKRAKRKMQCVAAFYQLWLTVRERRIALGIGEGDDEDDGDEDEGDKGDNEQ